MQIIKRGININLELLGMLRIQFILVTRNTENWVLVGDKHVFVSDLISFLYFASTHFVLILVFYVYVDVFGEINSSGKIGSKSVVCTPGRNY